jgi:peptidoglycan/LPS O-acetylase OafA/YrhL
MTTAATKFGIKPGLSVLLDLTRVALALLVAVGHWTHFFQDAIPHIRGASAAVAGFFVLSGFTIRMLYPTRAGFGLGRYTVERVSRIWSVAIPALALTVLLDSISMRVGTEFYMAGWGENIGVSPETSIVLNFLGLAQVWGADFRPLSNHPFWSISYELGFYAIFGLLLARRYGWALFVTLLLGPNVAFMMLLWLAGAGAYELVCSRRFSAKRQGQFAALLAVAGSAGALFFAMFGQQLVDALFGAISIHPRNVTGSFGGWAALFLAIFAPLVWLATHRPFSPPAWLVRASRWLGNLTFPIYLFHFPIFVLIGSLAFYDRSSVWQSIALFSAVCVVIALLTPMTDWLKVVLRSGMNRTRLALKSMAAA